MAQVVDVNMPQALDLQTNYVVRVTALDASGNLVAGVNITQLVLTGDSGAGSTPVLQPGPQGDLGTWLLVPGSGA